MGNTGLDAPTPEHLDRIVASYAGSRPGYPAAVFDQLRKAHVVGPGVRVLEIGAGTGEATTDLVATGADVTAVEPRPVLAKTLAERVPQARVVVQRLEDLDLAPGSFDAAIGATSLHWLSLDTALPMLHDALRAQGRLAVLRTTFGDASVKTPFRRRVAEIVKSRVEPTADKRGLRPTMRELTESGLFLPVDSWEWPWSIELTAGQIERLFTTFSDWSPAEVAQARAAADDLGGKIVEHYRTWLHVLEKAPGPRA